MATANKVEKTKVDSARTTPASPEWWAQVPDVSDPEPTLASITFNSGKEARRFGTVLQRVVNAEVSDILARAGLLHKPESTEGGRRVSVLKRQEGAPVNLG